MEAAEKTSQENPDTEARECPPNAAGSEAGKPVRVESDLDFIRALNEQVGDSLKKCFQCGTCSATCAASPDGTPFPRKEMAWAVWGMKDHLLKDPDVWLCYQCSDCSTRCPRGAKPAEVLAAVRRECVRHYAVPRFLGRWVNEPQCIPLLLGIPAALLAMILFWRDAIGGWLGISNLGQSGEKIVYSYSSMLPHWLLNSFFGLLSILILLAVVVPTVRFWWAMKGAKRDGMTPAKGLLPSILTVLGKIFSHDKFPLCTKASTRFWSHLCVFFGFLALCLVAIWVITISVNPIIRDQFIYPFSFWSPWKILANAGGLAILAGCSLMIADRFGISLQTGRQAGAQTDTGTYFDWALITALVAVVLSGFATEVLHYVRLEPHRHLVYFAHLVLVMAILMYLPYSKFAHVFYRTAAMVYAEYSGREAGPGPAARKEDPKQQGNLQNEEEDHAPEGSQ